MPVAYLGLGGNLGNREANLLAARERLQRNGVGIDRCSSLYETEPWGVPGQPRFLNAVCRAHTALAPQELLRLAKRIERELGRLPALRYGPRTVDIDILTYDDLLLDTPDLTIPHPRLAERPFVLVPLAELAPGLCIPGLGRPVRELLEALGRVEGVEKVAGASQPGAKPEA